MTIVTLQTTTNFVIKYDDTQTAAQGMAQSIANICESEFTALTGWFGITTGFGVNDRITVTVQPISAGGANNFGYQSGGNTTINVGPLNPPWTQLVANEGAPPLFIAELSEVFMSFKWPSGNIFNRGSSSGEGLSQFCASTRFPTGWYQLYPSFANNWLTQNPRPDWVTKVEGTDGDAVSYGCSHLYINYLNTQLGFTPDQIIQNGATTLDLTYQTLTSDTSQSFGFFSFLLNTIFPVGQPITGVASSKEDNPFPIYSYAIELNKNSFSLPEVKNSVATDQPFLDCIRVVLEGCSPATWTALGSPTPQPISWLAPSTGITDMAFVPRSQPQFENQSLHYAPQRIEWIYDVTFSTKSFADFTTSPKSEEITSTIALAGNPQANAQLVFYGGEDPYFLTFAPGADNVPWLSNDLRVFSAVGGSQPVPEYSGVLADSTQGAYTYITGLIAYLSKSYGDAGGVDPFDPANNVIPGQAGALQGDTSVVPNTLFLGGSSPSSTVYNFAIARVRLNGAVSTQTNGPVRVFFRLWSTQSPATTYVDTTTYNSHMDSQNAPDYPLPDPDDTTVPFCATDNYSNINFSDGTNKEYGGSGVNSQIITIQYAQGQWTYYGCFLNVYDPKNSYLSQPITKLLASGTHHCITAQIAYDETIIPNGANAAPGAIDKLAQRNLSIAPAYNPGLYPTNRIPQTFDVPPTNPSLFDESGQFDELVIDWGQIPKGTLASIYWPGAKAAQVISLANGRYAYHDLTATDATTIQTRVARGLTFIPLPVQTGPNLASLLTIELPPVRRGNSYTAIVKRLTTMLLPRDEEPRLALQPKLAGTEAPAPMPQKAVVKQSAGPHETTAPPIVGGPKTPGSGPLPPQFQIGQYLYRITTGAFQVNIPVQADDQVLPYDEETLSIMKYRLGAIGNSNKWYPVISKYIGILKGRIDGHGGNSESIPPSQTGLDCPPGRGGGGGGGGHYPGDGDHDGYQGRHRDNDTDDEHRRHYH